MQQPKVPLAILCCTALALAGCSGGTPWGATPQNIPLPRLENIPAELDAGSTAGSQRLAERVRATLQAAPRLAGANLRVEGLEGGLIVLSGSLPTAADRDLARQTVQKVAGVRDVVDRMANP